MLLGVGSAAGGGVTGGVVGAASSPPSPRHAAKGMATARAHKLRARIVMREGWVANVIVRWGGLDKRRIMTE
ncbi:hypothetical protein GCM10009097_03970 [Pigmentiphaga daeguensis]|uniref:Uncharacterized protein n=1 Tax=Pigmentiphaga daeguensis TaxID=414049 RepID=A0ABP3L5Z6_9BURK